MMKPLVSKAASGFLQSQGLITDFWKMLFWLIKEVKGSNIKDQTRNRVSKCQSAQRLLWEQTSLSQYYSQLTLTWWLGINQPSDVGTLCSAASSLCPSSLSLFPLPLFHLLPDVNKFDQADVGKLLFGCHRSALWQILYPVSSAPQSLAIPTSLICYPPPPPPLQPPPLPAHPALSQTLLGSWGGLWHVIEVTWLTQSRSTKR